MEWTFTTNVDTEELIESLCEDGDFKSEIAGRLNTYEIACELSISDIAYEIDSDDIAREIAGNIDYEVIVRHIDLAEHLDDLAGMVLDLMPDRIEDPNASNDRYTELQAQVATLTQRVERLMGVLDWSLDNMRKGIVHVDTNQDFKFGAGIEPVEPKPVWTIEEVLEQEERIDKEFFSIPVDHHAQTQGWNDRPNYL